MSRQVVSGLAALALVWTVSGGAPSAQMTQAEDAAVLRPPEFHPGDAATVNRHFAATLDWENEALLGEYQRHGHRDSHWDEPVEHALRLLAREYAHDPLRPADLYDQVWFDLQQAMTAGCDDALIEFLAAEVSRQDLTTKDAAVRIRNAVMRLERSRYSAYRRGSGLNAAASALLQASPGLSKEDWNQTWPEIDRLLDRAIMLTDEVAQDKRIPDDVLMQYVNSNNSTWVDTMKSDRRKAFDYAYAAIAAHRDAKDPLLPLLRTRFYALYAWDIRGSDFGPKVKDEAWAPFKERLHQAEAAAAEAVALGSSDPAIPRSMTQVVKGLRGNVDELDAWFKLGVAVDPGDRSWYEVKLDWLMPKWFGSIDQAVDYVASVKQTGSWNLRVPLLVVDLFDQLRLAVDLPKSTSLFDLPDACTDILPVYDTFVKRYPNAGWDRGRYVMMLVDCREWQEADRQMKLIAPERLRVGAFGGRDAYDVKRKLISLHLH